ncbi:RNA-directed DNA polymerase [Atopobacter phocae]|uniref:RNA-directed DNA polymerase n=1 Tax=Atopobacter phocae TaxID=136492 RepID=UPI00146FB08F|nr:RNA-directed DNA polymerase [Atopobacter phocae]
MDFININNAALIYWSDFEQKSLELNLKYNYLLKSDIANFYSSIYTHTLSWAIHGEKNAKENKKNRNRKKSLGDRIDGRFQYMNYGETVGIPQGNAISDLMSELLLFYIDSLLVDRLKEKKISNYKIIRYRDDYRIFTQTRDEANIIKKELIIVLQRHKLSLGENKTSYGEDIIKNSVKEEKQYWMIHNPTIKLSSDKIYRNTKYFFNKLINIEILNKCLGRDFKQYFDNRIYKATPQKHMYLIKLYADKYPNSGQLVGALKDFENRISDLSYEDLKNSGSNIVAIISILIDIIQNNPKITEPGIKLLSLLLNKTHKYNLLYFLKSNNNEILKKQDEIINLVTLINDKMKAHAFNPYLEIWLQRIVVKNLREKSKFVEQFMRNSNELLVKLCNEVLVGKKNTINIFNQEWISAQYRIDNSKFINIEKIEELDDIISNEEIRCLEYDMQ